MDECTNHRIVFVVDDEALIANTLAIILRQQGFDARVFTDGSRALLAATCCTPDVLLTDVAMPSMNGFELARAMSLLRPDCSVLFLSGHALKPSEGYMVQGEKWRFISKPVHPVALLEAVREELGTPLTLAAG